MTGPELRARREALKLSQADFAALIGVSRDFLGQMERGVRKPSPRTLLAIQQHARGSVGERAELLTSDPMERLVEAALQDAGIAYVTDRGGRNASGLDFRLPDHGVEIEVKRFHTPRSVEQTSRAPNVILLQGETAIRFFCDRLRAGLDPERQSA